MGGDKYLTYRQMRKIVLLLWLSVYVSGSMAQELLSINGEWLFCLAKTQNQADILEARGFFLPEFDASEFVSTPVPSNWAVLGFEEPVYRGFKNDEASEGFYLKRFAVPPTYADKRVLLHFGGVWNSAEVWLNGIRLGRHDSGYTSFSFDVSKAVKTGGENLLAVRVRQVFPGYKTDTYDDWTLGGIYRDVTLESMPAKRRIDNVRVQTKMNGEVEVRVMVADTHRPTLPGNYRSPGKPYQLQLTLMDRDGNVVVSRKLDVASHTSTSRETLERLMVNNPNLWSAETPYLYTLRVDLMENGEVAHSQTQKIGIREISTKDGVFRINGQAVKLRGVNRHDEHPDVGRATTPKHWLEDLQLMKAANINYIRACHYQHAKGFIEMCDSIGMYVGAEVSLGGASGLMMDPSFVSAAMLRTVETVERDLNNPSIIYWSIGNEDSFTDLFLQCTRVAKGLDPTRPILYPWNADETLPKEIDILAPHYWTSHEYDSIASKSKRPIITTEYVHAYGNQRMGGLDECFKALTRHPAGAGGAVWMWADQGIKTPTKRDRNVYNSIERNDDYLRIDGQGWDGITDSYRRPTQDYWEVKAVYCPVYPEVDTMEMNENVQIPIYNGYDFTDLNNVHIGWQLFVDGKQKDAGTTCLEAAPHTVAHLQVPTRKIGKVSAGQTVYLWLTFTNPRGQELGQRAVELTTSIPNRIVGKKLSMSINPATGLPEGIRPTIWHKLNDGDEIIRNRKGLNLENYTTRVLFSSTEQKGGETITKTEAIYEVNDSNRFTADYIITQTADGSLTIDYAITPLVQTNYVPIIGLAVKAKSLKQWFGLGPEEAYPNKRTAPILGLWSAANMSGTRAMRWADIDNLRVYCDGYLDRDIVESNEIRFLSHVLGRSEKGRLNYPEYRLESGKTYHGSIVLVKQ